MTAELDRFRRFLAQRLGWSFDDNDAGQLAQVLARRAAANGLDRAAYLVWVGGPDGGPELAELTEALTINETYFFRHGEQFRAVSEVVLPERIKARAAQRTLRMLSVGCSSGEEAYTLAIVAREARPGPDWVVSVLGLDASSSVLERAAAGQYSAWSLRETPDGIRSRWFRPRDGRYELAPEIRSLVRFRRCNVADEDQALWRPGQYDVVFCRNLLMYLTPQVQASLIRRMTAVLDDGGYLFLGHTDSLGSRPEGLEPQQTHRTFYYKRVPVAAAKLMPVSVPPAQQPPAWKPPPAARPDVWDKGLRLLADERFAAALALVEAGLGDRPEPREQLLHAVLLAQAGRLTDAEAACRRLVDVDGLYADAHHQLAVCHEGALDVDSALEHYRLAAFLDPEFAMPRLRIGLLARRRGDNGPAGAELEKALALLRGERDDRIVLFGGGFGRIALTTLCRTELEQTGATR